MEGNRLVQVYNSDDPHIFGGRPLSRLLPWEQHNIQLQMVEQIRGKGVMEDYFTRMFGTNSPFENSVSLHEVCLKVKWLERRLLSSVSNKFDQRKENITVMEKK